MSSILPTFASYLPRIEKRVVSTDVLIPETVALFRDRIATGHVTVTQEETISFSVTSYNVSSYDESRAAIVAAMKAMPAPDPASPEAYKFQLAELLYERHQSVHDASFEADLIAGWEERADKLLEKATTPDDKASLIEVKLRALAGNRTSLDIGFIDSIKALLQQELTLDNRISLQASLAVTINRNPSSISIAREATVEALRLFEEHVPSDPLLNYKKAMLLFDMGLILILQKRYEEAEAHFKRAAAVRVITYGAPVLVTTPLHAAKPFLLPRSQPGLQSHLMGTCYACLVDTAFKMRDKQKLFLYGSELAPYCAGLKTSSQTSAVVLEIVNDYESYQTFYKALTSARADFQINAFTKLCDDLSKIPLETKRPRYAPSAQLYEFHCLKAWGKFFYQQLPGERAFDNTQERPPIDIFKHVIEATSWYLRMVEDPAVTKELKKLQLLAGLLSEKERWTLSIEILPLDKASLTVNDLLILEQQVYLFNVVALSPEAGAKFIEKCLRYINHENAKYFYKFDNLRFELTKKEYEVKRDIPRALASLAHYVKDAPVKTSELTLSAIALDARVQLHQNRGDFRSAYADALRALNLFKGRTGSEFERAYTIWAKRVDAIKEKLKPKHNSKLAWHIS